MNTWKDRVQEVDALLLQHGHAVTEWHELELVLEDGRSPQEGCDAVLSLRKAQETGDPQGWKF